MSPLVQAILLLSLSNVFMTFAKYGRLRRSRMFGTVFFIARRQG